jgi:hypothetical protein
MALARREIFKQYDINDIFWIPIIMGQATNHPQPITMKNDETMD